MRCDSGRPRDSRIYGWPSVANAKVALNNQEQGTTREDVAATDGSFVFTQLQPGTYTLSVEATGFKKFEQKNIKVFANDRVGLGDIILSLGQLTETVLVESQVAMVQTASAERAGVLTSRQVMELSEISRSLGRKSHSTVVSAEQKVTQWLTNGKTVSLGHGECRVEDVIKRIECHLRLA